MLTKKLLFVLLSLLLVSLASNRGQAQEARLSPNESKLERQFFAEAVEAAAGGNKNKLLKIYDYDVLYDLADASPISITNALNDLLKKVHQEAKKIFRAGDAKGAAERLELAFDFSAYAASKFDDDATPPDRPPEYWLHNWKAKPLKLSPLIYIPALNDYAFFLQKVGQDAEAIRILQAVVNEDTHREVAYLNLADSLWRLGRDSEAKPYFEKYKELMDLEKKEGHVPEYVTAILHLSSSVRPRAKNETHSGELDFTPFMAELQRSIKKNWSPPKGDVSQDTVVQFDVDRQGQLSNFIVTKSADERYKESAIAAAKAAHAPPLPAGAPEKITVQFHLSYNIIKKEDKFDAEVKLWKDRLSKNPTAENHFGLAEALESAGDFEEAEIQFKRALKLAPKNQHYLALWRECQRRMKEVHRQIAELNKKKPKLAKLVVPQASLNNEGVKALNAGDYSLAIDKLREALAIQPGYRLARNNLAIVYNNRGIHEKENQTLALADFHRSLLLKSGDFGDGATEKNIETLLQLRGKTKDSYALRQELADELVTKQDYTGAIAEYQRASKIKRDDPKIEQKLAAAIARIMSASYKESDFPILK